MSNKWSGNFAKLVVHTIALILRRVPAEPCLQGADLGIPRKKHCQHLYMLANAFMLYCVSNVKTVWQEAQLYFHLNHTSAKEMESWTFGSRMKSKQGLKATKESTMLVVSSNKLCCLLGGQSLVLLQSQVRECF